MLKSEADKNIRNLYDKFEDDIFQIAFSQDTEEEGQRLLDEIKELENDPEFAPSPEATKNFNKFLNTHLKGYRKKPHVAFRRLAVAMLSVIILLSTLMVSVQAFRVTVMNFLVEIKNQYTSFQIGDNGNGLGENKLDINWTDSFMPTYIPEGYEVSGINVLESVKQIIFIDATDKTSEIIYWEFESSVNPTVDSENALLIKKVNINDSSGTLIEKDGTISIVWQIDDNLFMINSNTAVGEDETIKIAKSVKFIN